MNDFDPTHGKISDQPLTIGGDKSAAAWHPNSGPEVPHADLIAKTLKCWFPAYVGVWSVLEDATVALVALIDSLPRDDEALIVARAERDALAHVIEQARMVGTQLDTVKADVLNALQPYDTAPAVSLALRDAEVKAQALDEAADELDAHWVDEVSIQKVRARAAAIREEAGS